MSDIRHPLVAITALNFCGLMATIGTVTKGEEREDLVRRLTAIKCQLMKCMDEPEELDFETQVANHVKIASL